MASGGKKILNFINGAMVEPSSGAFMDNIEPAMGKVYGQIPDSDAHDVEHAAIAAKAAFSGWRDDPEGRITVMNKLADLFDRHAPAFVEAESRDQGKTITQAGVEIPRGPANFRAFAAKIREFSAPHKFKNETPQAEGYILHQPAGVAGIISPWNLPFLLFTWKVAPALAAGCTVVAKPSEITPMTAFMMSELLNEAGFPPGVMNIVNGTGPKVGSAIVNHKDISRVSFTGSTATGRAIGLACAQNFKKPPLLEMGGKNPAIIFNDSDFETAVAGGKASGFTNQGEICLCSSRHYVQRGIYDRYRNALVESVRATKIGDPLEADTQMGAVASEAHMNKVLSYIELAKREGGKILTGGHRHILKGRCADGYFIEPTVIEGLANSCRTNQEEIFGPVVTLIPFDTEEEAIALANDSEYGLAATIWTEDHAKAMRVADRLETGMPWINTWNLRVLDTPFGGWKNSGNGHREGAPYAMEFFTELKTVTAPSLRL
jgi:aminomuconate-semialdehyde/2-hydroxymuconate-6-semialdehyde dehydrogenase